MLSAVRSVQPAVAAAAKVVQSQVAQQNLVPPMSTSPDAITLTLPEYDVAGTFTSTLFDVDVSKNMNAGLGASAVLKSSKSKSSPCRDTTVCGDAQSVQLPHNCA